jgi:hypothetical protein
MERMATNTLKEPILPTTALPKGLCALLVSALSPKQCIPIGFSFNWSSIAEPHRHSTYSASVVLMPHDNLVAAMATAIRRIKGNFEHGGFSGTISIYGYDNGTFGGAASL